MAGPSELHFFYRNEIKNKNKNIIIITWPFSYCHFIFMHFGKVLICNDDMPCSEDFINLKPISSKSQLTIFHNI